MRNILLALLVALAACADPFDPYAREGNWRPGGVNDHNLRAMIAAPGELVQGTGSSGSNGEAAADAIARLRTDRVRPLPETSALRSLSGGN